MFYLWEHFTYPVILAYPQSVHISRPLGDPITCLSCCISIRSRTWGDAQACAAGACAPTRAAVAPASSAPPPGPDTAEPRRDHPPRLRQANPPPPWLRQGHPGQPLPHPQSDKGRAPLRRLPPAPQPPVSAPLSPRIRPS